MLLEARKIHRATIESIDGAAGALAGILFDLRNWHVPYLLLQAPDPPISSPLLLATDTLTGTQWSQGSARSLLAWRQLPVRAKPTADSPLVEANSLIGCRVIGLDGELGSLADLVIDDRHWIVRYLSITLGTWWPGRQVLIEPSWVDSIDQGSRQVRLVHRRAEVGRYAVFDFSMTSEESAELLSVAGHLDEDVIPVTARVIGDPKEG